MNTRPHPLAVAILAALTVSACSDWQKDDGYEFFEYACNEDNYAIRNFIETSRFARQQGQ